MTTFVCLASGPSLSREDVERCRESPTTVICVNDTYRWAPWADYLYAADAGWWDWHIKQVRETFCGQLYTIPNAAVDRYGLNWIQDAVDADGVSPPGLGREQIHHGSNSGYQAVNLAYILGADRILLLGYDMKPAPDGTTHFFGDHPPELRRNSPYGQFFEAFETIDPDTYGVEIINCSRDTALTCFPRLPIADALHADT